MVIGQSMSILQLLLATIGMLVLLVAVMALIRKEAAPIQVIFEVLGLGVVAMFLAVSGVLIVSPLLTFIIIYLLVMRCRILVDIGSMVLQRGNFAQAHRLYRLALALRPDPVARASALINSGVAYLRAQQYDQAISVLEDGLKPEYGDPGRRYRAVGRFSLGLAYRRTGQEAAARQAFKQVEQIFPNSIYSRHAAQALKESSSG
ncbi:MAG: tetratricopeptide repeat protein [Chloroflexi bacterium]|nr:tetratricopeptide repeat protein [Chloroflexota bacterium]